MGQRRKSREAAFLASFSQHFTSYDGHSSLERLGLIREPEDAEEGDAPTVPVAHEPDWKPEDDALAAALVAAVDEHRAEIDRILEERLVGWTVERLSPAVAALLRLGIAELRYIEGIPANVTIDEYVELTKRYAEDEAPSLVNAVLDRIHKSSPK